MFIDHIVEHIEKRLVEFNSFLSTTPEFSNYVKQIITKFSRTFTSTGLWQLTVGTMNFGFTSATKSRSSSKLECSLASN